MARDPEPPGAEPESTRPKPDGGDDMWSGVLELTHNGVPDDESEIIAAIGDLSANWTQYMEEEERESFRLD